MERGGGEWEGRGDGEGGRRVGGQGRWRGESGRAGEMERGGEESGRAGEMERGEWEHSYTKIFSHVDVLASLTRAECCRCW